MNTEHSSLTKCHFCIKKKTGNFQNSSNFNENSYVFQIFFLVFFLKNFLISWAASNSSYFYENFNLSCLTLKCFQKYVYEWHQVSSVLKISRLSLTFFKSNKKKRLEILNERVFLVIVKNYVNYTIVHITS